jgi:hypothetical protein
MPIILINKQSGQQIMVKGESSADFYGRQHSGLIPVEWLDGHDGHVMKDAIWATRVIPLEEHNKNVEDQKQAQEEKAKEDQARRDLDQMILKQKAEANAAWRRKFFLIRLFSKRPFPEVA